MHVRRRVAADVLPPRRVQIGFAMAAVLITRLHVYNYYYITYVCEFELDGNTMCVPTYGVCIAAIVVATIVLLLQASACLLLPCLRLAFGWTDLSH